MASKLVGRIIKLENMALPSTRIVRPWGYWYGEDGCEPYETDAPIRAGMSAYYEGLEKEKEEIIKRKIDQKSG